MNVIVICLDTLRWDHLGCYGNSRIRTPAIDRFAQSATPFDAAYCASFPTVPMRTDAFTGDVHWPRYGWKNLGDETTVIQVLNEAGYRTALILDTANMVGAHLDRDFQECYLIKKTVDDGIGPDDIAFPFPREHARQNGVLYARQMASLSHYRHESDWAVAQTVLKACQWLEDNYRRERFFLWVDTFEIHEVWHTPSYYVDLYDPGYKGVDYSYPNYGSSDLYTDRQLWHMQARYAAEVTLADKWVGLLLRQIEEMGLFENSMVVLLSDHGMYLGDHGRVEKHTVDPANPWPLYDELASWQD